MRPVIALLVAAMLAGCAAGTPLPAPPRGPVPDMQGTWRGTWGGAPAALLVTAQDFESGYSGVFVGGSQVAGSRRPGITGVLTSTIQGEAVSARADGWFGSDASGRQIVLVQAETPDGLQRLTLARVNDDRLQGTGESSFRWGPQGPAQLTRQTR
jgi:hypothetical protein